MSEQQKSSEVLLHEVAGTVAEMDKKLFGPEGFVPYVKQEHREIRAAISALDSARQAVPLSARVVGWGASIIAFLFGMRGYERKTNTLRFIGNAVKMDAVSELRSATLTTKGRAERATVSLDLPDNADESEIERVAAIDAALAVTPKYSDPLNKTKQYLSNTLLSQKTRLIAEIDDVNGEEGGLETWRIALAVLNSQRVQENVQFGGSIQELDGAVTMTIARVLDVSESTARRKRKAAYERINNVVKRARKTKDSWARSLWAQINHSLREEVGSSVVSATFHINAGKKKVTVANVIRSKQILAGENQ